MIIGLYISKICQEGRSHVKCSFCNRNKNEKVSSGILYPEKKKKKQNIKLKVKYRLLEKKDEEVHDRESQTTWNI